MTTSTKLQYALNWHRIFGKKEPQGNIFLMPSEACGAIIQYDPDFKISCLIPPKKRSVIVDWRGEETQRTVDCPPLILSHLIYKNNSRDPAFLASLVGSSYEAIKLGCVCSQCEAHRPMFEAHKHAPMCACQICSKSRYRQNFLTQLYYLFAIDMERPDEIWAQPYRLTNVYEDAKMCFRKENSDLYYPQNLRQAHGSFWMHKFDNDFNMRIPHSCNSKMHRWRGCRKRMRQQHQCTGGQHDHKNHTCKANEDGDLVGTMTCKCCQLNCMCYEDCACCMNPDNCGCAEKFPVECACNCCRDLCVCQCGCDLKDKFADFVENYKPDPEKWENYTAFICGSKFFSVNKRYTGVFVSQDKDLMSVIPKEHWRRSDRYNSDILIGVTNRLISGAWKINLGRLEFTLSPEQIRIIA